MEHENDGYTNCNWGFLSSPKTIGERTVGLGNKKTRRENPIYNIAEIGLNTKKSPSGLRRLLVTKTPVKDHLLSLI